MFIFSACCRNKESFSKTLDGLPKSEELDYRYYIYPVYNGKGETLSREEFYVECVSFKNEVLQYVYTPKYNNGVFSTFLKTPSEEVNTDHLYKTGLGDWTNFFLNLQYYILYMKNTKQLTQIILN
jgi:hypothetical protein